MTELALRSIGTSSASVGVPGDARLVARAVIYEVYPRSFADGDGDGIGDLAGRPRPAALPADLGVDAIWLTPWYRSPMADGGYDVADYRAIDPAFGTLADAEALIAEALGARIRTIVDVVPNHVSDQHEWFQAALAAGPGSPERARFWFRPGEGETATRCRPRWRRHSRARRGRARPTPTARPASGTSTCSPPPSRT